jgi:deoxyribodipyrimidine photo-lyase
MKPELVWFKRDLRISDHSPLVAASKRGPVVCLYIYEPELLTADDASRRHLLFINDSLRDLATSLEGLGARLILRCGEACAVLEDLWRECGFERIRVHQETTNGLAFARDRRVLSWARNRSIDVVEYRQQGVVRRLPSREGWGGHWQSFAQSPLVAAPRRIEDAGASLFSDVIRAPEAFRLADDGLEERQEGGEAQGQLALRSFLKTRSEAYVQGLSSPVTAWEACSRLSPYLAYGNLSIRSVYQRAAQRRRDIQRQRGAQDPWAKALTAYLERLAWHCHFMQKLEDEPRIEFENMNPAFDGLREGEFNEDYFEAWAAGRTGYPMVDACMRALRATGWINFRMRAMLISFASHHLWLHWRRPALHLARLFVDYEPGIHYSQIQMQAGTDGISALRMYSPTKQVLDHDPNGDFIRRWLPELARVPAEHIAEPQLMPRALQQEIGCVIGRDYPAPIVDHLTAYGQAQRRLQAARREGKRSGASMDVFQRHGSRRKNRMRAAAGSPRRLR